MSEVSLLGGGEATEQATKSKPGRRQVRHMAWVREAKIASEMGVSFPRLCGIWRGPQSEECVSNPDIVETVGGIMPVLEPRDCRNCARVLEARRLREYQRRGRR